MRVFVTGGSGFVGGHFIETAKAAGHDLRAMARSTSAEDQVRRYGAEPVRASLDDIDAGHLEGCEAVVHAAAHVKEWGTREEFFAANVEGTERLLSAARRAKVRRFVHVGTEAAVFDGKDLVGIDERYPFPATHRYLYSESKAAAEQKVLAANGDGLETVCVRPRLVWGPRDAAVLPAILSMVKAGKFSWIDGGRKRTSTTHVINLAHALVLALSKGRGGESYFVADAEEHTIFGFFTAAAATQGVLLPSRSVPSAIARPLAHAMDRAYRLVKSQTPPPLTAFAIDMLSSHVTVATDKARRELGYQPVVTFEQGLAEMRASS